MKIEKTTVYDVVGLTEDELRLLIAAVDFHSWGAQGDEIAARLVKLSTDLTRATDFGAVEAPDVFMSPKSSRE